MQRGSHENPLSGGERRRQPSGVGPSVRNNPPRHPSNGGESHFHAQWRRSGGMENSHENPLSGGERRRQPSGVGPSVRNNPPRHPSKWRGIPFSCSMAPPKAAWGTPMKIPLKKGGKKPKAAGGCPVNQRGQIPTGQPPRPNGLCPL